MELVFKLFSWKLDCGSNPKLKQASHRWPAACAFMERGGEWEAIREFLVNTSQNIAKIPISWYKYLFHVFARNENGKLDV